jgi:hypothetical protein
MWNVTPVIIGATGTISKLFRKTRAFWESTKSSNYTNSHIGHSTHTVESTEVKTVFYTP